MSGMTNVCELLINVVMYDKPKVLTGLGQKACGWLTLCNTGVTRT